ncbi:MAG TPA: DUF6624 domain-containing protein [Gemmatimonadaceae bacterium]|jgi:hypothetical protein
MDSALRDQLLRMDARDQTVRAELAADGSLFKGYHPRMEAVHRENAARLREIILRVGWPGEKLVGKDGAHAAWRIAQHSIGEPAFMRACRGLLDEASRRGDAPRWQFAMMDDRIRAFEGVPQRYGSQLRETINGLAPYPLEDVSQVEEWRREVGLPSLGELLSGIRETPPPTADEIAEHDAAELAWRRKVGWMR